MPGHDDNSVAREHSFVPNDAEWFIGYLVTTTTIAGTLQSAEIATTLIAAKQPDKAYEKALRFGKELEVSFNNTDGELVEIRFCGVHELNVIHEPLQDGAELAFSVHHDLSEQALRDLVRRRDQLSVYRVEQS